jgi:flagellar basal-body rod protein FlgB
MVDGHVTTQNGFKLRRTDGPLSRADVSAPFFVMTNINDFTMKTTEAALDGLVARSKARANNIVNAETTGFKARSVDFESALREAGSNSNRAVFTDQLRDTPVDARGNSVNLELEVTEMVQDNLLFQAMVNGYNYKARLIRTAIGNG